MRENGSLDRAVNPRRGQSLKVPEERARLSPSPSLRLAGQPRPPTPRPPERESGSCYLILLSTLLRFIRQLLDALQYAANGISRPTLRDRERLASSSRAVHLSVIVPRYPLPALISLLYFCPRWKSPGRYPANSSHSGLAFAPLHTTPLRSFYFGAHLRHRLFDSSRGGPLDSTFPLPTVDQVA